MSEIPTQASPRGFHESGESSFDFDPGLTSDFDTGLTSGLDADPTLERPIGPAHAAEPDIDLAVADVDLDSDPFADDLDKELAAAAPKRWTNRATFIIGALVLVVGGFLGGIQVQKHFGTGTTAVTARSGTFAGGAGAARGFGGAGGLGAGTGTTGGTGTGSAAGGGRTAAAGNATSGTVKLVDGTTIYVQLANGDIVTVKTTGSTKVSIASTGKLSSLKAGEQISINGSADSTGTVTATTVTATP